MIVDTSALVAILRAESDAPTFAEALASADAPRMSAISLVEAAVVIDLARDPVASRRVDDVVRAAGIAIEPVTEAQARIARQAYRDFGRGSAHPAKLNVGDCFSYALAKAFDAPLLLNGDVFVHTDVTVARD